MTQNCTGYLVRKADTITSCLPNALARGVNYAGFVLESGLVNRAIWLSGYCAKSCAGCMRMPSVPSRLPSGAVMQAC